MSIRFFQGIPIQKLLLSVLFLLIVCLIFYSGCTTTAENRLSYTINETKTEEVPTSQSQQPSEYSNGSVVIDGYWVSIDPIGNHSLGNYFTISGKTNLPENTTLHVAVHRPWLNYNDRIHWANWCLMHEGQSAYQNECGAASAEVNVIKGNLEFNCWKFDVDGNYMSPIRYLVEVKGPNISVKSTFSMMNTTR